MASKKNKIFQLQIYYYSTNGITGIMDSNELTSCASKLGQSESTFGHLPPDNGINQDNKSKVTRDQKMILINKSQHDLTK